MFKAAAQLEVKIGERIFTLSMPTDSPLGEVHDALYQMRCFVLQQIDKATKFDAPPEREDDKLQQ